MSFLCFAAINLWNKVNRTHPLGTMNVSVLKNGHKQKEEPHTKEFKAQALLQQEEPEKQPNSTIMIFFWTSFILLSLLAMGLGITLSNIATRPNWLLSWHPPPPPWCIGLLMRGLIGANPPTVKLVTSLGWNSKTQSLIFGILRVTGSVNAHFLHKNVQHVFILKASSNAYYLCCWNNKLHIYRDL